MGFKVIYIPEKHKKLENMLNEMGVDASGFILESIIKNKEKRA